MKKTKIFLFAVLAVLLSWNLTAQEAETEIISQDSEETIQETAEIQETISENEETETSNSSEKIPLDFSFIFPRTMFLSNGDKKHSAPSPVVFNPGIGCVFPNNYWISFQPMLSFYYSYYLWYEGRALPAEIENRVATTLSFMLDLPVSFAIPIKSTKLELYTGPAILMRFGWKANGTSESDAADVKEINSYFWSKARFLYLTAGIDWMVPLPDGTKFGPFGTFYLPVGSLAAHEGMNATTITIGLKVTL